MAEPGNLHDMFRVEHFLTSDIGKHGRVDNRAAVPHPLALVTETSVISIEDLPRLLARRSAAARSRRRHQDHRHGALRRDPQHRHALSTRSGARKFTAGCQDDCVKSLNRIRSAPW